MKEAIKKAFPVTIPIMLGYVPLGMGFGLIMAQAGYNALWAFLSAVAIYSGTGQYMSVNFLATGAPLLEIVLIIVILNTRMMFYGLTFLSRFSGMGWKKWYMVYTMSDETYAVLCTVKAPEGIDDKKFMFCITMLNQIYWVTGCVVGALFGTMLNIDITGVDFMMTALFIVLCMDQWEKARSHQPFWIGLCCSILSIVVFGPNNFMIPALAAILACLVIRRKSIEKKQMDGEEGT